MQKQCPPGGGAVACWGQNYSGQLGNSTDTGTNVAHPTPTVIAGLEGVSKISAGQQHTCAVMSGGAVKCWGINYYGQLGNSTDAGTAAAHPIPTTISGLSDAVAISAGSNSTCVLRRNATVSCWGYNGTGQLGSTTNLGTESPNPTPTQVASLTSVVGVTAGNGHTCAVRSNGDTMCWGYNPYGQLGNPINSGTSTPTTTPTRVPGSTGAVAVVIGNSHTCAIDSTGVSCWGLNDGGQLANESGLGTTDANPSAVQAVGLGQVRTTAKSKLSLTAPRRDARAPYVYGIKGSVAAVGQPGVTPCSGTVRVTLKYRARVLATRTARVTTRPGYDACTYSATLRVTGPALTWALPRNLKRAKKPVTVTILARYSGSGNLAVATARVNTRAR